MVDGDGSLHRIGQVDLDLDLKLTPPSLCHLNFLRFKNRLISFGTDLIWWFGHNPIVVCITVMQLEIHLKCNKLYFDSM